MSDFLQRSLTALKVWFRLLSTCVADLAFTPRVHESVVIADIDTRGWRLSSYAQNQGSGLLGLPPEVRPLVYRDLLIADSLSIQLDPRRWSIHTPILRVCRLIYNEARLILCHENCSIMVKQYVERLDGSAIQRLGAKLCQSCSDSFINELLITRRVQYVAEVEFEGGRLKEEEEEAEEDPAKDTDIGGLITLAHMCKLTNLATSLQMESTEQGIREFQMEPTLLPHLPPSQNPPQNPNPPPKSPTPTPTRATSPSNTSTAKSPATTTPPSSGANSPTSSKRKTPSLPPPLPPPSIAKVAKSRKHGHKPPSQPK